MPAFCSWRMAVGRPPTRAIGRYSTAPAAALVTVGVTCTARWRGSTTPVTPAHSAERSRAPRLPGSVTPSTSSRNGGPAGWPLLAPLAGRVTRSSSSASGSSAALASTPWGASVRASAMSLARVTSRTGTPTLMASSAMSSSTTASSWSPATQTSRTRRVPASSSSRTAWRPSTCSPPSPRGAFWRRGADPRPDGPRRRGPSGRAGSVGLAHRAGRVLRGAGRDRLLGRRQSGAWPSIRAHRIGSWLPLGSRPWRSERDDGLADDRPMTSRRPRRRLRGRATGRAGRAHRASTSATA